MSSLTLRNNCETAQAIWTLHLNVKSNCCSSVCRMYLKYSDGQTNSANSVDEDQMSRSAASDLRLHFLPPSISFNAHQKIVKWISLSILVDYRSCHYENKPIQIYAKFNQQKNDNFQIKILILFIFLLKT